jgi:putative heme-binding domain-containing protein
MNSRIIFESGGGIPRLACFRMTMKDSRFWRLCIIIGPLLFSAHGAVAQEPQWIWNSTNQSAGKQVLFFRKRFIANNEIVKAKLYADADDGGQFFINGKKVATVEDWHTPAYVDVTRNLVHGENILAVRCENQVAAAGVIVRLEMTVPTSGSPTYDPKQHAGLRVVDAIVTSTNWLYSDHESPEWNTLDFDDGAWKSAVAEGKLGDKPWGNVFETREATPAETITVLPGFKVELLHSANFSEGSWISMVADDKGRLIISPQSDDRLLRVTLSHGQVAKIERIDQPVSCAMGLLYAGHCLYVNGHGPKGTGVYRLRANGDLFEPPVLLRAMISGEGEHGTHGLVLGPDNKIYVVSGNFTKLPPDLLITSPLNNYADDQLLPRAADGKGFGNGVLPPGGFVLRMDLDGANPELFAAGTRNTYDIAFSPDGELFGFDSDMEWDWGTSWYRPIRINHLVSGADYGFREGTGKFPEYYEDTLPANLDVGIGSPTGVKFATTGNFPEKYRKALFMLDWSYGRIFAVHLTPAGATYDATVETVLRGIPLNLTALDFGRDGALYFITGGRGTESGLYRLTYIGPKIREPAMSKEQLEAVADGKAGRRLRHDLEYFHGKRDPRIVDVVWPCLASEDRWIRYAARIALEFQDVAVWKDRALAETNPIGGLTALLALARCGPPATQRDLLMALKKFPLSSLDEELQLLKLRVIELSFSRQGRPAPDLAQLAIEKLDAHYPSSSERMNRELCQLLLYLRAPDAITKTLALLDQAPTQEEQTRYILHLRTITNGWPLDQRKHYLSWFNKNRDSIQHPPELLQYFKDAGRDYSDGASLPTFLTNFLQDAIASLNPEERTNLAEFLAVKTNPAPAVATPRKLVKEWRMPDVEPDLDKVKSGRSFASGQEAFTSAQCILCHRFGKTGGAVGPELAAVSSRLTSRDILESILLPSKVVSEQYQNTMLILKDGDDVTGRIVEETDQKFVVVTDPIKLTKVEVRKSDVASRRLSKVSPMPEGLVNFMTEDQILDLIAYLQSGGKTTYAAFKQ